MTTSTNPPSNTYAIDVQNLTVGYGSNVLMKDLNFTVNNGEIFVILGGSGCGKSSLLKNLFGLYQPLSGDVLIEGQNITQAQGAQRQKIMTSFGVMYQQGALFGSMTLLENVRLFMEEYTELDDDEMDRLHRKLFTTLLDPKNAPQKEGDRWPAP